jgi:YD repeat-containing protein
MHPGWVGNGWSLQAGGVITRKANGFIDEFKKSYSGTQGYYFNYGNLNPSYNWSSTTTLSKVGVAYGQILPPANPMGVQNPFSQISDVDTQPDEFDFNFPGYSGKFFLDQTGNWQVQCDKALKVVFNPSDFVDPFIQSAAAAAGIPINNNDICKTFGKFTIIDEYGNQYVFGSTDQNNTAIEFTDLMIPQSGFVGASITATSWFLTKIISAGNTETINLNYVRGPFTSFIGYEYSAQQFNIPGDSHCQSQTVNPGRGIYSGRIVSPVYLSSITMPSQSLLLDFSSVSATNELTYSYNGSTANAYAKVYNDAGYPTNPPPNDFPSFYTSITSYSVIPFFGNHTTPANKWERFIWLKLDGVIVKNSATNTILRTILFSYNNDPQKRLQLSNLKLLGSDNQTIESNGHNYYSFFYNQTSLPNYLTIYGDHWGFNNYSGSNNLSAGWGGSSYDFFTPRNPDPTGVQTQAEILTDINYPTGGTSSFFYEPNQYSSAIDRTGSSPLPTTQAGIAGGLRIKKIVSTDLFNASIVRKFFYVNGYVFGSNPDNLTSSGVLDSKPKYSFVTIGTTTDGRAFTNSFISSNSVIPVSSNSMGTYIGYSSVIEQRSDGSYTSYQFTNHDNGYADQAPINSFNNGSLNGFQLFNSLYFERGQLLNKMIYNNTGQKVTEDITQYSLTIPTATANAVFSSVSGVCDYNNVGAISRTAYSLCYSPFLPVSSTSKVYPNDGRGTTVVKSIVMTYNQYKNIIQQQTVNSRGEKVLTNYKYPTDYTDATSQAMLAANILSPIIESSTSTNEIPVSLTHINYYSPYTGLYVPQNVQVQTDNNVIETLQQFYNYDIHGNLLEQSKISDPAHVVYLWGYNSQYIVAKIVGSTYATVSSYINQSQLDAAVTDVQMDFYLSGLRNALSSTALITTYTYTPLIGMTSQTDSPGQKTTYQYDSFQRLSSITDNDGNIIKTFKYKYQQ